MSIVERLTKQRENPVCEEELQAYLDDMNRAVNSFYMGEINSDELFEQLGALKIKHGDIQDGNYVRLDFPGPMYGLLRKIGYGEKHAFKMAEHERRHWRKAQENGAKSYALFGYSWTPGIGKKGRIFRGMVVSDYSPAGLSDEALAQALIETASAPDDPSEGDRRRIPSKGIVYERISERS